MSRESAVYARIFARDLQVLAREVALYPDDAALWKEVPGQPTLGGSLALHLVGNLRHFVGRVVGGTDYVRDREAEFESRGRSRKELQALIQAAQAEVAAALAGLDAAALAGLDAARLDAPFPEPIRGHQMDTRTVLVHLITHLSFHLGQLDYHRRAATGDRASAEPGGLAHLLAP